MAQPVQQRRIAGKISARLDDLGRMVNDMLGFAAGAEAAEEPVVISELLDEVISSIQGQLNDQTKLGISSIDSDLRVAANKDALKGALQNLVSNAEQACVEAAIVTLSGYSAGGFIHLSVSDNGPGITEDVLPRLFEPFFTTRPQGTGLGLAVVHAVAKAHNGDIDVSTSDKGTTFTIRLPATIGDHGAHDDD